MTPPKTSELTPYAREVFGRKAAAVVVGERQEDLNEVHGERREGGHVSYEPLRDMPACVSLPVGHHAAVVV